MEPEPMGGNDTVEGQEDKLFSGYYLIGAINHNINREKHEVTMELIKDSLLKTQDQK